MKLSGVDSPSQPSGCMPVLGVSSLDFDRSSGRFFFVQAAFKSRVMPLRKAAMQFSQTAKQI